MSSARERLVRPTADRSGHHARKTTANNHCHEIRRSPRTCARRERRHRPWASTTPKTRRAPSFTPRSPVLSRPSWREPVSETRRRWRIPPPRAHPVTQGRRHRVVGGYRGINYSQRGRRLGSIGPTIGRWITNTAKKPYRAGSFRGLFSPAARVPIASLRRSLVSTAMFEQASCRPSPQRKTTASNAVETPRFLTVVSILIVQRICGVLPHCA